MTRALFSDSQLQLDQTRRRAQEFYRDANSFWSINSTTMSDDLAHYRLQLHTERLEALKPLVGEVVTGFRNSLDLLIGEAVRISIGDEKAKRVRNGIKFPFPDEHKTIDKELNSQRRFLSQAYQDAISQVFEKHATYQYYFRVVRSASNNSKHWKLEPIAAQAHAVQISVPGNEPQITNIPKDHFLSGEPFEWDGPRCDHVQFVTGLQFADFPADPPNNPMPPSPYSVFSTTERYVQEMIDAFKAA